MTSYLVAGASRGIGLALAQALASKHDTNIVYAGVRNLNGPTISSLKESPKIHPIELDITKQSSVDAAVNLVAKENKSLDVLILNAAIALGTFASTGTAEDLEKSLETNTTGVYRTVLSFLPLIRASPTPAGNKKIIAIGTAGASFAIASQVARGGMPIGTYGISKAAAHFMIMLLAAELAGDGIVTATVNPGVVQTDMATEMIGRVGEEVVEKFRAMGFVPVSADVSADRILTVIKGASVENSGSFLGWKEGGEVEVLPF